MDSETLGANVLHSFDVPFVLFYFSKKGTVPVEMGNSCFTNATHSFLPNFPPPK